MASICRRASVQAPTFPLVASELGQGRPISGVDRGKTVAKPLVLSPLGLPLSETQRPKLLKTFKVEVNLAEAALRPRQVRATGLRYAPTLKLLSSF